MDFVELRHMEWNRNFFLHLENVGSCGRIRTLKFHKRQWTRLSLISRRMFQEHKGILDVSIPYGFLIEYIEAFSFIKVDIVQQCPVVICGSIHLGEDPHTTFSTWILEGTPTESLDWCFPSCVWTFLWLHTNYFQRVACARQSLDQRSVESGWPLDGAIPIVVVAADKLPTRRCARWYQVVLFAELLATV